MAETWPPVSYWEALNGTCNENSVTERAQCFGRGTCVANKVAGYATCDCKTFYDPLTFCNSTIFDTLQGRELVYPIVRSPLLLFRP